MSGVSVAVLVVSLRSGERGHLETLRSAAPVGVVAPAATAAAPTPAGSSTSAAAHPRQAARASSPATRSSGPSTLPAATRAAARSRPARPATSAPPPTHTAPSSTTTVNGAPADTRYGPVQVQVSVRNRRIIRADAIVYPMDSSRDQEINSQAIPQLDDETLRAQSAQIDTVSGATYTSDGYRQSLQSALDAAHGAGAL
jgi:uncharacterized protein with FMN-binding domain